MGLFNLPHGLLSQFVFGFVSVFFFFNLVAQLDVN